MADVNISSATAGNHRNGNSDVHARIGSQLKALYDDVMEQPVPDRFADLLRRLEEQDIPKSSQEQE